MKDGINVRVEAESGEVFIKYLEPTEFIQDGFCYNLRSTQAVIDLINKRGSVENTQIFYQDSKNPRVEAIIDDSITWRELDSAVYMFEHSDLLQEWEAVLNKQIDQKSFIDFLKHRDPEKEFPDAIGVLAAVQQLKIATQITGDYSYDDRNNYTFAIKVKDAEDFTRIPSILNIHIPILNESSLIADVEVELEITKPRDQSEKPTFKLTCPRMNRYIKAAVAFEIDRLKAALPGYNIMAGSPR